MRASAEFRKAPRDLGFGAGKGERMMNSQQRAASAIRGLPTDRTPIYGWLFMNLKQQIANAFGSVEAFEDRYEFDMAHLFGGPSPFDYERYEQLRREEGELTPDLALSVPLTDPNAMALYEDIRAGLAHHKQRGRFCYVQTPGFFENFNGIFGIENQLCYTILYREELRELYRRQAQWTKRFAENCIELGADMIHISDDWGAQRSLLFSDETWRDLIYPPMKEVVDFVHSRGAFVSLHSDGCVASVAGGIAELGIDMVHPWQESAGMTYELYLREFADRFALLGGVCIQTSLGFGRYAQLEADIRRVFSLLRGKRWVCCTTHFVQEHCSMEELKLAYDLIYRLAREG